MAEPSEINVILGKIEDLVPRARGLYEEYQQARDAYRGALDPDAEEEAAKDVSFYRVQTSTVADHLVDLFREFIDKR